MLYYHASSLIDIDKLRLEGLGEGRQRIIFSHEPGLSAVLIQLAKIDKGKGLVRIALGVSKDKGILYFSVKLARIKDTLDNFRNHRLYTDIAA